MATAANDDSQQFIRKKNRRKITETIFREHQNLSNLIAKAGELGNDCLQNDIPRYPRPEFIVSRLRHDTDKDGLKGISENNGFRNPFNAPLVWWSLDIGPEEINTAEQKVMMTNLPNEQVQLGSGNLKKFASSPVFQESSRLGAYRFTFPLKKVLEAYRKQFCNGEQPTMRAFRTYLYKQEVMYVVLVHRPCDEELFSDYPLLTDTPNPVCAYKNGHIIGRVQAMCETHKWKLEEPGEIRMEAVRASPVKRYVWDNVSVALHVDDQVLTFHEKDLGNSLAFCKKAYPFIGKTFDTQDECITLVKELWPECPALQKTDDLVQSLQELKI